MVLVKSYKVFDISMNNFERSNTALGFVLKMFVQKVKV